MHSNSRCNKVSINFFFFYSPNQNVLLFFLLLYIMKIETENEMNTVVLNPQQSNQQIKTGELLENDIKLIDFRSLRHQQQDGFTTEIGSSDANKIKEAIEISQQKAPPTDTKKQKRQQPIINTIAGYRVSKPLPDTSRIGWTAFSSIINPGGSLGIRATENHCNDKSDTINWQDSGIIFLVGLGFWAMIRLGGGVLFFVLGLFFISKNNYISTRGLFFFINVKL